MGDMERKDPEEKAQEVPIDEIHPFDSRVREIAPYLDAAAELLLEEDYESAVLAYEMAMKEIPGNRELKFMKYGTLVSLLEQKIKSGAKDEGEHIEETLAGIEIECGTENLRGSYSRKVSAREAARAATQHMREGDVPAATALYLSAVNTDPSNTGAIEGLQKCMEMTIEHMIDTGEPNSAIQAAEEIIKGYCMQPQEYQEQQ